MQVGAGAQAGHFVEKAGGQHGIEALLDALVQQRPVRRRNGEGEQRPGRRLGRRLLGMPDRKWAPAYFINLKCSGDALAVVGRKAGGGDRIDLGQTGMHGRPAVGGGQGLDAGITDCP